MIEYALVAVPTQIPVLVPQVVYILLAIPSQRLLIIRPLALCCTALSIDLTPETAQRKADCFLQFSKKTEVKLTTPEIILNYQTSTACLQYGYIVT